MPKKERKKGEDTGPATGKADYQLQCCIGTHTPCVQRHCFCLCRASHHNAKKQKKHQKEEKKKKGGLVLAGAGLEHLEGRKLDVLGVARRLETRTVERDRAHLLLGVGGALKADADLRETLVVAGGAVEVDLGADEGLDDRLDLGLGVEGGGAGDDAVLFERGREVVAAEHRHGRLPVVEVALGAVVHGRRAGAVLLGLVEHKLAALERGPVVVERKLEVLVVHDAVEHVLTLVRAGAARRVLLALVVGPHAVHREARGVGGDVRRKLAAVVVAERARPRLDKDHVRPVPLVRELAVGVHVTLLARHIHFLLSGSKRKNARKSNRNKLHRYCCFLFLQKRTRKKEGKQSIKEF